MAVSHPTTVTISPMQPDDWPSVAAIYGQGIDTGNATFETAVPSWAGWNAAHLSAQVLCGALFEQSAMGRERSRGA